MAWVKQWHLHQDTGKKDKYGPILVQTGDLSCGVKVYRRRRERNKDRYMYWCEGGKAYSERFDKVLVEAQALASKGEST